MKAKTKIRIGAVTGDGFDKVKAIARELAAEAPTPKKHPNLTRWAKAGRVRGTGNAVSKS